MEINKQNIVAIDVGLKRIGLAKSALGIVLPLKPIIRHNRNQAACEVRECILKEGARILVCGVPKDNEEMCRRIYHFVKLLELDEDIKVVYVDESFSSHEALSKMAGSKKERKKDGSLDSLAASVILERFLMSQK
ncbi:Holliday junction resolvase RuvX [Helicobacter valdiviensis]|uniref:Putative pre-16S rRNA nuclease n=1 Tax=Helicobacter valdiviensis TaxID=1458358 RepID=A0A2W6NHQ1_9HELI|nr:Holliday junction resolvase RuvX [Helicobacter valdiviensis]PZT48390.1 Holliday junction resolvase RuvX [Helicobacter valdiviensis]